MSCTFKARQTKGAQRPYKSSIYKGTPEAMYFLLFPDKSSIYKGTPEAVYPLLFPDINLEAITKLERRVRSAHANIFISEPSQQKVVLAVEFFVWV